MEQHRERLQTLQTNSEYSDVLVNIPFWIEDKEKHQYYYDKCRFKDKKGFCCFAHSVGLPMKEGFGHLPFFNYQIEFVKAHAKHKLLREIKATGLGFSELLLYLIGSIAYFPEHRDKPCEIPILTGPNIDIAKKLIKRLELILTSRLPLEFDKTQTTITIKNCTIEAFPSHHIDAVRALPYPIYCLLDEADFFPYEYDDPNNPVRVIERYIPKSNPWIVLISTPNLPGGLYERMDEEEQRAIESGQMPRYKTFRHNYEWGLGKIYSIDQIEEAKKSPSFEREYNLKYGFGIGNVYNEQWIGLALLKGRRLKYIPAQLTSPKSMGIDPAWGSSKFGITIMEYLKYCNYKLDDNGNLEPAINIKRVILSQEYEREQYERMVDICYNYIKQYNISKIFVDGSQIEFIKSLKNKIGEETNYEDYVDRARKFDRPLSDYMDVIPLYNQEVGKRLIDNAKYWMGISKTVAIDEETAQPLIKQMRSAKQKDTGVLDKYKLTTKSTTYDALESYHYALQYWIHNDG